MPNYSFKTSLDIYAIVRHLERCNNLGVRIRDGSIEIYGIPPHTFAPNPRCQWYFYCTVSALQHLLETTKWPYAELTSYRLIG